MGGTQDNGTICWALMEQCRTVATAMVVMR